MSTARKVELLKGVIDEGSAVGGSAEATQEWCQKAIAVLRSTLGRDHPTIDSIKRTRFAPRVISPDTLHRDADLARRRGVTRVVALLKGAIVEVEAKDEEVSVPTSDPSPGGSSVFLVHGHAEGTKYEVARFIHQETGEWPVILHEKADQSQTIIEKLERHGSAAGFAVVLLTADDEGREQGADGVKGRARQNVVFEHGYFIGKLGRERVVALYEDGVELPSDLSGVLYIPLAGNWKMDLLRELRAAAVSATGSGGRAAETQPKPARAGDDEEAGAPGHRQDRAAEPAQAFTARWRHTTDGMDAAGVMNTFHKRLSHPGYGRDPGSEPPAVRFGLLLACSPLGEKPSTTELRQAFCSLLNRPPVWSFVSQLTELPNDLAWRPYGGNGRLSIGAILAAEDSEKIAPIASAMLILHDAQATRFRQGQCAELILYVGPCDEVGLPAPPATLERWHERLVTALEVPAAFATFLISEVGLATYADPPTQLGVCLEAQPTIGALVDTRSLQPVAGSTATQSFPSYVIAEQGGREPAQAAVDVLRVWCDYALRVDGYEEILDGLV